jgi:hypothetical protein
MGRYTPYGIIPIQEHTGAYPHTRVAPCIHPKYRGIAQVWGYTLIQSIAPYGRYTPHSEVYPQSGCTPTPALYRGTPGMEVNLTWGSNPYSGRPPVRGFTAVSPYEG